MKNCLTKYLIMTLIKNNKNLTQILIKIFFRFEMTE